MAALRIWTLDLDYTPRCSTLRAMTAKQPKISSVGYALLGLLQPKPASGYHLSQISSSTSMKTDSDSRGDMYPLSAAWKARG